MARYLTLHAKARRTWATRHPIFRIELPILCGMNSSAGQEKRSAKVGRIVLAVLVGYTVNALLIAGTESLLVMGVSHGEYFLTDVVIQCLVQVASGYLCSRIAGAHSRPATLGLIGLGLLVGIASVAASWQAEPHWYAIALLLVYSPCVWLGYRLEVRRRREQAREKIARSS